MITVFDGVRSLALVLGLRYISKQSRKTWMWGESILWCVYALALFICPNLLFPGTESDMMSYLVRVFAALLVGMESMWYLTRNTRDECVVATTLWSRLMGSSVLLFVLIYSYSQHPDKFPEKTLYFDMFCYVLLFCSTVYHMCCVDNRVGGQEQKGHVSTLLRINFLVTFFTGLLNLAFPSWVIPFKKLSVVETIMMRSVGAMFFGMSINAWYATSFRYDDDRSAFFLSEIMTTVLMFIGLNIAYFRDGLFDPRQTLILHLGCVPALLVLAGLYLIWRKQSSSEYSYYLRSKAQ